MKQATGISERIKSNIVDPDTLPKDIRKISYSQYSTYKECPHRWYLKYAKKHFPFSQSIDTVFGTAMHETLQKYLELLFNTSIKAATDFKILTYLKERLVYNYSQEFINNNEEDFATPEQLKMYFEDGVEIIKYIKRKRKILFDNKNYELVGIELPVLTEIIPGNDNIVFQGFIDVVIRDKTNGRITIIDIKTSKSGWKDEFEKRDQKKIDQILLYKRFFSQQFNIPIEDIDVIFFIVKRKINQDSEFPIPRVQQFKPANGKLKINQAVTNLHKFLHECYSYEGAPIEKKYRTNPGDEQKNCKFCPFKDKPELCNKR